MTTFDVHAGPPLAGRLLGVIALWRARHGMSAQRFGTEAMGDPCFHISLARGRSLRLHTADRALAFMGRPPLGPLLRTEVEVFLAVSGTKASVLGEEAVGNPAFVGRLRRGASPQLSTFDRVRAWMAANASEEELRAVRGRLVDVPDPFEGTRDAARRGEGPRGEGNLLETWASARRWISLSQEGNARRRKER